jgi:HD-GYP domain-containing protein (c-di-GMP phosphodiesterase class II)
MEVRLDRSRSTTQFKTMIDPSMNKMEQLLSSFETLAQYRDLRVSRDIFWNIGTQESPIRGPKLFPRGSLQMEHIQAAKRAFKKMGRVCFPEDDLFEFIEIEDEALLEALCTDLEDALYAFPGEVIDSDAVKRDLVRFIRQTDFNSLTLSELHKIKAYAPTVYACALQTAILTMKIVKDTGGNETEISDAGLSGLLCNVSLANFGMWDLLDFESKPLDESAWKQIKQHPLESASLLTYSGANKGAVDAVMWHHENIDGSGYYGLQWKEIPELAKILRASESYVSMTNRVYKEKMDIPVALAELHRYAGRHYEPRIVAFITTYFKDSLDLSHYDPGLLKRIIKHYLIFRQSLTSYNASSRPVDEYPYISGLLHEYSSLSKILHDLRSPLQGAQGYFELFCLANHGLTKEDPEFLSLIMKMKDLNKELKAALNTCQTLDLQDMPKDYNEKAVRSALTGIQVKENLETVKDLITRFSESSKSIRLASDHPPLSERIERLDYLESLVMAVFKCRDIVESI